MNFNVKTYCEDENKRLTTCLHLIPFQKNIMKDFLKKEYKFRLHQFSKYERQANTKGIHHR